MATLTASADTSIFLRTIAELALPCGRNRHLVNSLTVVIARRVCVRRSNLIARNDLLREFMRCLSPMFCRCTSYAENPTRLPTCAYSHSSRFRFAYN